MKEGIKLTKTEKILDLYKKRSAKDAKEINEQQQALSAAVAIVRLRNNLGLSQRQFSKLVQIPHSTISRIENGDMNPSSKLLGKIAVRTHRHLEIQFV